MIKLEGIVLNVFTQQGGKDKKTGDQFADRDKVQILGAMDLPNGDVKNELFTLSVENYRDFSDFLNQKISIAVGATYDACCETDKHHDKKMFLFHCLVI